MAAGTKRIKKEKSAGAIIFRKGGGKIYYLLLHYESGHWDFPKGHVEEGENEKTASLREIKEETSIEEIDFIEGFRERITYFFKESYKKKKGPLIFKEVIFYLAETKDKEVKISYEHIDFAWLLYDEAFKKITFRNAKEILNKANDFLLEYKFSQQKIDFK